MLEFSGLGGREREEKQMSSHKFGDQIISITRYQKPRELLSQVLRANEIEAKSFHLPRQTRVQCESKVRGLLDTQGCKFTPHLFRKNDSRMYSSSTKNKLKKEKKVRGSRGEQ